ncbi:HPP family protein [Vogesella indigofera]|uniref:HPP family protein n=1 Tax=Vogesella indigofera TaxID=45465 RepID=UPI00234CAB1A|nr:HPP family protein [Vogesella indigofera]MDC7705482.1 HPP family protein [Vogesella indigofera]MDC7710952.1 HPP family protein [Vogesella indigofera]
MKRFSLPPSAAPLAPSFRFILLSFAGALLAIASAGLLSRYSGQSWLMAPFGASCVLVFGLPDSPLAQPRHVIGGHLLAAAAGLLLLAVAGPHWWSAALAVALAIALMQAARMVHPPAGATPLVVLSAQADWHFLLTPVLTGTALIVATGWLVNRWRQPGSYPRYWW